MKIDEFVKYAEESLLGVPREKWHQILTGALSLLKIGFEAVLKQEMNEHIEASLALTIERNKWKERADQYKNDNDALVIELEVLRKEEDALRKRVEELREQYDELIMSVGNKYPNETRHLTALRYIQQAEHATDNGAKQALKEAEDD